MLYPCLSVHEEGMMSLPVWSHVLFEGERGLMSLTVWSHVLSSRGMVCLQGICLQEGLILAFCHKWPSGTSLLVLAFCHKLHSATGLLAYLPECILVHHATIQFSNWF